MRSGGDAASDQNLDPSLEKSALMNKVEALQSELDIVRKRLSEIETGTGTAAE